MKKTERVTPATNATNFLPQAARFENWADLSVYTDDLLQRPWKDAAAYRQWIVDWDAFEALVGENGARRFIAMTANTADKAAAKHHEEFVKNINPPMAVLMEKLRQRALASEFNDHVDLPGFALLLREWAVAQKLFRNENIALNAQQETIAYRWNGIDAGIMVEIDGQKMSTGQLRRLQKEPDRALRERAWRAGQQARLQVASELNDIFSELVPIRHRIALNAGYANYRDYMHDAKMRFDYGVEDCLAFHAAVKKTIVPALDKIFRARADQMGLEKLRPWDLECDPLSRPAISFNPDAENLIECTQQVMEKAVPGAGEVIARMRGQNLVDVESRANKAQRAYLYYLPQIRLPFLFSDRTRSANDITSLTHEGGHAYHNAQISDLPLGFYQEVPMEVSELASYGMEFMSSGYWDIFLPDAKENARVRYDHLLYALRLLVAIAQADEFQHRIYTQPDLSAEQRCDLWQELCWAYRIDVIDWSGLEVEQRIGWHHFNHIFETPFYMIEYGFAKIGALELMRQYQLNPEQTAANYSAALALGSTRSVPEIYRVAGLHFGAELATMQKTADFACDALQHLQTLGE